MGQGIIDHLMAWLGHSDTPALITIDIQLEQWQGLIEMISFSGCLTENKK